MKYKKIAAWFHKRVSQSIAYYHELVATTAGKKRQAALEGILADQFAMSLCATWEAFISDLILAYIETNPLRCIITMESRIRSSIRDKFGTAAERQLQFRSLKKLSKDRAQLLVDHKGFNISIRDAEQLSSYATEYLDGQFAKKFSLTGEDRDFFNYIIAVRNFLAHRSRNSRVKLKEAVGRLAGSKNIELNGSTKNFTSYLKSKPSNTRSRVEIIAQRLDELCVLLSA